tara:strand:+ start:2111 stop:2527 length:417 start_codon:yes stop_codon:yes gene_type:complete
MISIKHEKKLTTILGLVLAVFLLSSFKTFSQDLVNVSGAITSEEDGMPLPGVNVFVKETSYATVTDFDGNFNLEVPVNSTLTISYVGFITKTIEVDQAMADLQINLQTDVAALSEVVVVGYGSVKKDRPHRSCWYYWW